MLIQNSGYERQFRLVEAADAPQGRHFVQFENSDPDRGSRLLQGFAVDGQRLTRLKVTTWVKCSDVRPDQGQLPSVVITFYDDERRELGQYWLGPWQGSQDWQLAHLSVALLSYAGRANLQHPAGTSRRADCGGSRRVGGRREDCLR